MDELDPDILPRANRQFIIHIDSIENIHSSIHGKLELMLKKHKDSISISLRKHRYQKAG